MTKEAFLNRVKGMGLLAPEICVFYFYTIPGMDNDLINSRLVRVLENPKLESELVAIERERGFKYWLWSDEGQKVVKGNALLSDLSKPYMAALGVHNDLLSFEPDDEITQRHREALKKIRGKSNEHE